MSGIDIASNSALLSVADKLDMQNIFLAAIAGKESELQIKDWENVQTIVRAGLAPKVFAVGDQLCCNHENYGELVWDIVGFDHDTPTDKNLTHSMTLVLHNVLNKNAFDQSERFFYAEDELPAGTYNFPLPVGYNVNNGGNANKEMIYSFTLENSVPKGGYLIISWEYGVNIKDAFIKSYMSDDTQIEVAAVSDAVDGGLELKNIGSGINSISRARFGSNDYKSSAIRKWLNSNKTAGNWWSASYVFDRAPGYAKDAGFLAGLDKDFVSVIGKTQKTVYADVSKNDLQVITLNDYMFLLSSEEVYGSESNPPEGKPYDYFKIYSDNIEATNNTDSNRIKYYNGTAVQWNLRTPGISSYNNVDSFDSVVRSVIEDGSCSRMNYPYGTARGVVPACCII